MQHKGYLAYARQAAKKKKPEHVQKINSSPLEF